MMVLIFNMFPSHDQKRKEKPIVDPTKERALNKFADKKLAGNDSNLEKLKKWHAELGKHIENKDHHNTSLTISKINNHMYGDDVFSSHKDINPAHKEKFKKAMELKRGNEWEKEHAKHIMHDLKYQKAIKEEIELIETCLSLMEQINT